MSLSPQLESDLATLRQKGFSVTAHREPEKGARIYIRFDRYPLPLGWNKRQTRLLLITDISYPNSKLDMFWVGVDLQLEDGRIPKCSESIETHMGQQWRRFSWHVQKWNPAIDNVITYLATVDARLGQLE